MEKKIEDIRVTYNYNFFVGALKTKSLLVVVY